tara:strand:- start:17 stop:769 length:753 start_codon:yes stop_codon:yes gene_type:complete
MTTKIPVELSSTPSIVDNGDATAITIDSSEKVGINITNPADYYADQLVVSAPSEGGITLASTATSNVNYLLFADGTSGDAAYRGQIAYNHSNDLMSIVTTGTMDFRTGSSRTERLRILDGGGITFNGDTATANALDDYEEGTWTPSVNAGAISGTSISYSGTYTKIGRLVFISFVATNSAADINVSSYVQFSGVPFTIANIGTSSVMTEDPDQFDRHGFAELGSTFLTLTNSGSSSGTSTLKVGIVGSTS